MWRRSVRSLSLLAMAAICIANTAQIVRAQARTNRLPDLVVISIQPEFMADTSVIQLSDIARVDSRDPELKSRIEMLDVANAPEIGESTLVTRSLIELRLRLAGIDIRRVSIQGESAEISVDAAGIRSPKIRNRLQQEFRPPQDEMLLTRATTNPSGRISATTRAGKPLGFGATSSKGASIQTDELETRSIEEMVVLVAKRCILQQLPWPEDEISIRLVQPIARDVQALENGKSAVFTADFQRSGPPVGRVQIDVTVEAADRSTIVTPVAFDVRHFDNVVASTRPIPRGREIQSEDLYVHRWDVTGSADYSSDPAKLIGKVCRHAIPALQIIRDQDIETGTSGPARTNPVVIKRQDRVRMIAKIGDLTITVAGEAQQEGRVGDMIRVQNVESKTVVQGRVIRANEVEIME